MKKLFLILFFTCSVSAQSYDKCDMSMDQIYTEAFEITGVPPDILSRETFIEPIFILHQSYKWIYPSDAVAVYSDADNTINLRENLLVQFDTLGVCSIIFHEVVHAIQYQGGFNGEGKDQLREIHAYGMQEVFLTNHRLEYVDVDKRSGNGFNHVKQFKAMMISMAAPSTHDLIEDPPIWCKGEGGKPQICRWR